MVLRWGIVGAGHISHDFATALSTLPEDHHQIVAVAARDVERASNFAKLHNIPKAYGSYEEITKDADIDIVYVGTINKHHMEVGLLMLNNGKHIMVETAFCLNEKQARKLTSTACEKKLFCMEGMWTHFLPSFQYLRELLEIGVLGEIKEVNVTFHYPYDLDNSPRVTTKSIGGGILLDLGIFTIHLSQIVFKQPPAIKATGVLKDGCDHTIDAELSYPNGGKASIALSYVKKYENSAVIVGTKGQITLQNFWCCDTLTDVDGSVKKFPLPESKIQTTYPNGVGMRYEAEEIRKCIEAGKIQSDIMSHDKSIMTARITEEIRKQIGVVFDED